MGKRVLPIGILILGLVAVVALWLLSPRPQPAPPQPERALEVPVVLAQPDTRRLMVTSQGTLQPKRAIDLVAQVGGQVVKTADNFADGAVIQEGDSLLQIDQRDYRFALAQAEARVAQAAEALAVERGRARQAEREWRDLGDPDANALFRREPQIAAAEANLQAARAERDQAQLNLERTQVRAPFSGRIEQTLVNLGQYITAGTPVASIYDASVAEVRLPLTSYQAGLLDLPNQPHALSQQEAEQEPAEVVLRGDVLGRQVAWRGRLTRVQARVDSESRFQYVVAEVDADNSAESASAGNEQPPLAMGAFVEAEIESRPLQGLIELPATALVKRGSVYIVNSDNQVEAVPVELVQANRTHAWVRGAIEPGTPVMTDMHALVVPGAEVVPVLETAELSEPTIQREFEPTEPAP